MRNRQVSLALVFHVLQLVAISSVGYIVTDLHERIVRIENTLMRSHYER